MWMSTLLSFVRSIVASATSADMEALVVILAMPQTMRIMVDRWFEAVCGSPMAKPWSQLYASSAGSTITTPITKS